MRTTMRDVADRAGVSQATVSLVLNGVGHNRVAEKTRQRVLAAVRELGYRTNATAKSLRAGVADLVGFIGDEVASAPYAGELVEGAQARAWQDGLLLLVVNTGGDERLEASAVERMAAHQVRSFVYAAMYNRTLTVPEGLAGAQTVVLNGRAAGDTVWSVAPDEFVGGREATQVLLDAGHRRVAMINIESLDSGLPAAIGRHAGYEEALRAAGIAPEVRLLRTGSGTAEDGQRHIIDLMSSTDPPSAVFCANDRTAWGAYQGLASLGLRVPDDVSIIGFDNQELIAPHLMPGLTTMSLPFRAMGWTAMDLLLSGAFRGKPQHVVVHCDLVTRGSVANRREPR